MKRVVVYECGAMRATLASHRGLVTMDFSGVVTLAALEAFVVELPALLQDRWPAVYLCTFTRAVIATTADDLTGLFRDVNQDDAHAVPAAVVARPHDMPLFNLHAWQLAQKGILRVVFTDDESAFSWAQARAQRALPQPSIPVRRKPRDSISRPALQPRARPVSDPC